MSETANPVGRPSLYDASYCKKAIELGKLGKSTEQILANIGVGIATGYRWRDQHPDFREALEIAKGYEQVWWEDMAMAYMVESKDTERLNTGLWSRSMAARFPRKYSERIKQELTGAEGAPLLKGVEITFVEPNANRTED
jgi:hypothetical protein